MKNTKTTLLMSVAAAALIVGVGVASAQAPSPAPAAQQSAPVEKTAPVQEPKGAAKTKAPDAGMKSGQADDKMGQKSDRSQRAQDAPKGDMKSKGMSSETKSPGKTSSDIKSDANPRADIKPDAKTKTGQKADSKTLDKSSEKAVDTKAATTGQGASGGSANLSTEQRTTIRTVIKQQKVQPMTNVTFSISVGAQVPRSVHYHRVPVELVHIYPHWRGYDYFLVGDQIVVVNPRTHQIVAVLDA